MLIENIINYFNETWAKNPKPFQYTEKIEKKKGLLTNQSEAVRKTKAQTLQITLKNGDIIYNKRKLVKLPFFIFELKNSTSKLNALKSLIFNDYEFLNKLFLIKNYLFNEKFNEIWKLYNELKYPVNNLVLLNSIFEQNVKSFHNFPNSIAFQLSSRFSSLDDSIRNIIESFELFSMNHNSQAMLCPLYSFTPIIQYEGLKSLLFTNENIKCLISSEQCEMMVAFADNKLYFLDGNTHQQLNTISIEDSIQSIYLCDIMKDRIVIGHSSNEIYSYTTNGTLNYKKSLNNIKLFCMLNNKYACLVLENSNFLEVLNVSSGDKVLLSQFNSQICNVEVNVDQRKFLSFDDHLIYVIVHLKNTEIEVFHFNTKTEALFNISSIPATGLNMFSSKIDRHFYANRQEEYLLRFACFYEEHCCIFNINRTVRQDQKAEYIINDIKFNDAYLVSEYTSQIIDFYQNLVLFLLNSCIYVYQVGT